MTTKTTRFDEVVPNFMVRLMGDFPGLGVPDAAAIFGNAGHESGGLEKLQELKPVVKGSRGGYGWFQWTGPRRKAFEAWCTANGLAPNSDEANYGFLVHELRGSEKKAVAAVMKAATLDTKTVAFEKAFERAGVKHYPSRKKYALRALHAYERVYGTAWLRGIDPVEHQPPAPPVTPTPAPMEPTMTPSPGSTLPPFYVEAIQKRLRDLGYHMVGYIDGQWGEATAGAIRALQERAGLPPTGEWNAATERALANDQNRRVIGPDRATVTADDLAKRGSETIVKSRKIEWAQWGQIAVAVVLALATALQTYQETSLPFGSGALLTVTGMAWLAPVLQIALAFYANLKAKGVIEARVMSERLGIHNGDPVPLHHDPAKQILPVNERRVF